MYPVSEQVSHAAATLPGDGQAPEPDEIHSLLVREHMKRSIGINDGNL